MGIRLRKTTGDRITYDDSSANIVDGSVSANLQSAIANLDTRVDAIEALSGNKTILSASVSFYIDAVNGSDSNDGLSTASAFKSLLYCLFQLRDKYIINAFIYINILSDLYLEGVYSLRGFETTLVDGQSQIFINGGNHTLFAASSILLEGIIQPFTLSIENLNFKSTTTDSRYIQFSYCDNLYLYNTTFEYISVEGTNCKNINFQSNGKLTTLDNSSLVINNSTNVGVSGLELKNNSFINFNNCVATTSNYLSFVRISGEKTTDAYRPYIKFNNCFDFNISSAIQTNCYTLLGKLIEFRNSVNFNINIYFQRILGSDDIVFTSDSNALGYLIEIFNCKQFKAIAPSYSGDFISSPGNKALFVDNLNEITTPIDTNSILNLPVSNKVNLISTEAYINESNFRSSLGLTKTTQSAALDELALRNKTNRQTITEDLQLFNNSPAIHNLENPTGSSLNIFLPSFPQTDKNFFIINRSTSTGDLIIDGTVVSPTGKHAVVYDGVDWIEW